MAFITTTTEPTFRDRAFQALGILGFIAILLLGAWGIFRIVTSLPGIFNNLTASVGSSSSEEEKLTVTSPQGSIASGAPTTIAWTHSGLPAAQGSAQAGGSGNYTFTASYDCHDGLTVAAQLPNGSSQSVPCNTPFNFTNSQSSIAITPTYTGTQDIGVTFTVSAIALETGAVTTSAQRSVTLLHTEKAAPAEPTKPATPAKPTTPSSTVTYVNSTRPSNPNGWSDLAVSILSTGVISPSGVYTPGSAVHLGQRAGVQFQISNVGDKTVPAGWNFNAVLPLPTPYTYNAASQSELAPGASVVYTLGFDGFGGNNFNCYQNPNYPYNTVCPQNNNCYYPQGATYPYTCPIAQPYAGNLIVTIVADPLGYIPEINKANNNASATFNTVYIY